MHYRHCGHSTSYQHGIIGELYNPCCNFNEDQGAHEWISGCPGLPRITEELSSYNAPRRSGRVAIKALGMAMHQAATAEMAASRAWQAGQLLAAMEKT
jgi:hypothetical protein